MDAFNRIEKLMDEMKYDKAISLIQRERKTTLHVRKLNNLEAECYIKMGEWGKAMDAMRFSTPFTCFDADDINAMHIMATIYSNLCNKSKSVAYMRAYEVHTKKKTVCDIGNESREETVNDIISLLSYFSEENIKKVYYNYISQFKITEAVIIAIYAKKMNISNDEIEKHLNCEYPQAYGFYVQLLRYRERIIILLSEQYISSLVDQELDELLICIQACDWDVELILECKNKEGIIPTGIPINVINDYQVLHKYLIKISEKESKAYLVLGDNISLKKLYQIPKAYRYWEMFYRHFESYGAVHLECMVFGDFSKYARFIYGYDEIFPQKSVDFSIVIPARNSAEYLQFAVLSCLSQEYESEFEVVVSDNSDGNDEVYKMCKEIKDKHFRYIRTPFPLPLAKSFEYAILNARGRYILTVGSDDGLVPQALSILKKAFEIYPNKIVHFQTANYTWPSADKKLAGMLRIEPLHFNNEENVFVMNSQKYFKDFISGRFPFQMMPILYMSCCFSAEVVQEIIEKTGKFEFGESQDVYTGVVNLHYYNNITYIRYPLYMEGSSAIGIGRQLWSATTDNSLGKEMKKKYSDFRYKNYYSDIYNTYTPWMIYTKNEAFYIFDEYIKCISMGIVNDNCLSNNLILDEIALAYQSYPDRTDDINVLLKQMHNIAVASGDDVLRIFNANQNRWYNEWNKKRKRHLIGRLLPLRVKLLVAKMVNEIKRNQKKDYGFYYYETKDPEQVIFNMNTNRNVFEAAKTVGSYLEENKEKYDFSK